MRARGLEQAEAWSQKLLQVPHAGSEVEQQVEQNHPRVPRWCLTPAISAKEDHRVEEPAYCSEFA